MAGWLKRALFENFILKVVSLLLAVALWLAVASAPPAEIELRVPIEFRNLPENLEIDSASFTEAQIRLRGPERVINRVTAADVKAAVDLSSMQPGERTFNLTPNRVHVPEEVEVEQVIPSQFRLSFDIRDTRTIDVLPRVTGTFAGGLRVAQVVADPPAITITGPRRRVQALEAAETDLIDASGTMTRKTFETEAYVRDSLIQVVHPTPIRVTVIMERAEEEKK